MMKKCLVCNHPFRTYPSKILLGRGKYCSKACSDKVTLIKKGQRISTTTEFKKGKKPYNFKGWHYVVSRRGGKPYRLVYNPDHPHKTKGSYVREHRLVMESKLGRYLRSDEIVHHIDGDTINNNPDNLQVMSKKEHDRMKALV